MVLNYVSKRRHVDLQYSLRCFAFLGIVWFLYFFSSFYFRLIFCLYLILFSSPFLFSFPLLLFPLLPLLFSSSPHFLFPQQSNPIQSNPDRLNFGLFDLLPSHGYTLFWLGSTSPLTSILLVFYYLSIFSIFISITIIYSYSLPSLPLLLLPPPPPPPSLHHHHHGWHLPYHL